DAPGDGIGETTLDDPILERMVRDGNAPAAGGQPVQRGVETAPDGVELTVHRDPQRLEGLPRRVTGAATDGGGDGGGDDLGQAGGAVQGPGGHNGPGDAPRRGILPVLGDDP